MSSSDPDTLGATYNFLMKQVHVGRVEPVLQFDEVFDFLLRYYEWFLTTNPESEWANSRCSAGSDLVRLTIRWFDEGIDRVYLERIKQLLEKLYKTGDKDLKRAIEVSSAARAL